MQKNKTKAKPIRWTDERIEWMRSYAPGHHYSEIRQAFNDHFKLDANKGQIKSAMSRHGIKNGIDTRFQKGMEAYNKGMKLSDYMNNEAIQKVLSTAYKKGNRPGNAVPVGTEVKMKGGYVKVKIAEPNKWKLRERLVWENQNGPIPEGFIIIHINGVSDDDRIDNLMLMKRSELARLNKKGFYGKDEDINKTAIALAKLEDKIGS